MKLKIKAMEKGTAIYKKAQETANAVVRGANMNKKDNSSLYDIYFNRIGNFIDKIKVSSSFAGQIAQTIEKTMNPYNYQVARISEKQSWIIACFAVENGIEF